MPMAPAPTEDSVVWSWSSVPRAGVDGLIRRSFLGEAKPDGAAE
jgi:hypothetical protein